MLYKCVPGEKFRDWVRAQDGRAVTVGNAFDVGLQIVVRNNRDLGFERFAVGGSVEVEAFQVLSVGVLGENLGEDFLLDGVCVPGHVFNELQSLCALVIAWWKCIWG